MVGWDGCAGYVGSRRCILPGKNGIEAVRKIHEFAPKTKILVLSQDSDPAAARAALSAGVHGYVFKADSSLDLMPAVRAVMLGMQFVSGRFVGGEVMQTT